MSKNDDFYIGWQDEAPKSSTKYFKSFFIGFILLTLSFAFIFTKSERTFIDSYFDYGNFTEVTGYIVSEPVWGLLVEEKGVKKTIPLVGFGKFSAAPVIEQMKSQVNGDFFSQQLTIRGTVFQYNDRTWMELTEGVNSLVAQRTGKQPRRKVKVSGVMELSGEIVDPKCFFGVMNPASKAVHRSCAIRCISGGIPPVLAIREKGIFVDYYFVTDEDLNPVNDDILPFIGIPISLQGSVLQFDDWKVLKVSKANLVLAELKASTSIAICLR